MRISQTFRKGCLFRSTLLAVALALLAANTAYLSHIDDAGIASHGFLICDWCAQLGHAGAAPKVVAFAAPPVYLVESAIRFIFQAPPVAQVVASHRPRGPPVG